MKDLIEYMAKALVDDPDAVSVSEVEGEMTSVLELKVAKSDLGKALTLGQQSHLQPKLKRLSETKINSSTVATFRVQASEMVMCFL